MVLRPLSIFLIVYVKNMSSFDGNLILIILIILRSVHDKKVKSLFPLFASEASKKQLNIFFVMYLEF